MRYDTIPGLFRPHAALRTYGSISLLRVSDSTAQRNSFSLPFLQSNGSSALALNDLHDFNLSLRTSSLHSQVIALMTMLTGIHVLDSEHRVIFGPNMHQALLGQVTVHVHQIIQGLYKRRSAVTSRTAARAVKEDHRLSKPFSRTTTTLLGCYS